MTKNIAITIGINYQNIDNKALGLSILNYPYQDAQRLHDFLKYEENFDPVWLLSDMVKDNYPDLTNLIRLLTVNIPGLNMKPEDNLWFFFSGHGRHKNNTTYLMPVNGFAGNVEKTGFEINELTEDLKKSGAGNIILIIDACRDDGTGTRSKSLETESPKGIITIYSCAPGEKSYEIDKTGGVFTHVLLEGLRQNGGQNCATVERLEQYLLTKVPKVEPRQHPCIHVDPPTKKNFILLPRQATLQADIKRLKEEAKEAELEENYDFALELWQRINVAALARDDEFIRAISRILKKQAKLQREPEIESKSAIETPRVMPEVAGPTKQEYLVITVDSYGKEINRTPGQAQYFRENLSGIPLDMVFIKGDTFIMGSPDSELGRSSDEGPQHRVTVPDFYMGRYQVTQAQYQAIMGNNPSEFKGDNRPVEQVSWDDAVAFCQKLSGLTGKKYRLPSEAEWEYACRGGTTTPFHFGETITPELVNYNGKNSYAQAPKGQYREQTTEVGSFPPNAFGLYDMHGNVWEWCDDIWHDNYNGAPADGTSWLKNQQNNTRRLLRGGSWSSLARACRSANRSYNSLENRTGIIGFRLVVRQ